VYRQAACEKSDGWQYDPCSKSQEQCRERDVVGDVIIEDHRDR
jgi:hypothetical protein